MKMVDGSTVRHGRVDCSYPESASKCRRQSERHAGARGGKKEWRRELIMKREGRKEMKRKGRKYDGGQ